MEPLLEPLLGLLAKPSPVSDLASKIGLILERARDHPGFAYYSMLSDIIADRQAFEGSVPLLFDQKCKFLANFLSSRSSRFDSVQSCLIRFVRYYVRAKIRTRQEISIDLAIELLRNLEFSDAGVEAIREKLGVDGGEIPEDESIPTTEVCPPIFRFSPSRLSLTFAVSPSYLFPIANNKFIFGNPLLDILAQSLIRPISEQVSLLPGESELIFQPLVHAGDDFLISNVATVLLAAYSEDPETLSRVIFTWHVLAVDDSAPNEIATYLGSTDPVYRRFAERIFFVTSNIAPIFDEDAVVPFTSIIEDKATFSNHPWFTDPSPSNIFQFALHHYLAFGRSATMVNVWSCELDLDERVKVVVPFIASVHVGEAFSEAVTTSPPRQFPKDAVFIEGSEIQTGRFHEPNHSVRSLSVWNIESERRLRPNEDWVVAEWTMSDSLSLGKGKVSRAQVAGKITSKSITQLRVRTEKVPFHVMIDQRLYGPVRRFTIDRLEDPRDTGTQMQLRFATFSPPV
jgi:hypothetical protein